MILVSDLVKQYGAFTAVDGVSLDVQPGEIHGFLGPNGAGKTTTIRIIAGLLKATSGRVLVNGQAARATADNFAEWEIELPLAALDSGEISAHGVDREGNTEQMPHWIAPLRRLLTRR